MKPVGVLRFLGTNCDRDVFEAIESVGLSAEWLWYQDQFQTSNYSALVLPGGFSYGDYLRSGALAAKTPAMKSVIEAAKKDLPILGICNGFQILCEAGLLPGALVKNEKQRFIDKWVTLESAGQSKNFAKSTAKKIHLPVAHGDGCFYAPTDILKRMEDEQQVWWRYTENINGSMGNIAGVLNENKNVAGLMPHPERAVHQWQGNTDGLNFFESLLQ